jgi:NAD(P)-dependent dehydrogenase (short-subunit alcohol dehydrogenase family)
MTDLPEGGIGTRLAGKVAIVTGAGHQHDFLGTGAATSILFAAQGAKVGLVDMVQDRAEETLSRIRKTGGDAVIAIADVSDAGACQRAVETVVDHYGKLDILINNAGMASGGSVVNIDMALWDRVIATNLNSVMLMSRFSIPHLRSAGGGSIVNVSSVAAMRGFGSSSYAASKGGVIALTYDMAYTHGREAIRVNCIAPGHLHTPMGNDDDEEVREARRRSGMLGTEGTAWDVAWAAVYLASDESRWVSGVLLPIDAGTTATAPLAMRHHLGGTT